MLLQCTHFLNKIQKNIPTTTTTTIIRRSLSSSPPPSLLVSEHEREDLKLYATELPDIVLSDRNSCDLELILNGGFNPLNGFLTQDDTNSVYDSFRLSNGQLWPMPINLDISKEKLDEIEKHNNENNDVALRDFEGNLIAVMNIEDAWEVNKQHEAEKVFGGDVEHPAIQYLNTQVKSHYIGGAVKGYQLPIHYDYNRLRHTPQELRQLFQDQGWENIVAFQTRNPMHRAHIELVVQACEQANANALIHPVVGMTKPGDIDYHTRLKCIRAVMGPDCFGNNVETALSVLPLAMRMGGPREALWHMLIRKNYGATHFIVGRDHAGPGSNSDGVDFYGPYEARDFATEFAEEVGIKTIEFEMMVYLGDEKRYVPMTKVPANKEPLKISGTEVRRRLQTGEEIPEWFSSPKVVEILREAHPTTDKRGITLFFTGLSGSGKSTVANALMERLLELSNRRITLLDGDLVRHHLSTELGFSREHRNLNIQRIGYVASEVTKHGGIAICAAIAPYIESRNVARSLVQDHGTFVEVYVATSVKECAKRDRKGLYAKAFAGKLTGFTGVDDPYEEPEDAEIQLKTQDREVSECVDEVIEYLKRQGHLILDDDVDDD